MGSVVVVNLWLFVENYCIINCDKKVLKVYNGILWYILEYC